MEKQNSPRRPLQLRGFPFFPLTVTVFLQQSDGVEAKAHWRNIEAALGTKPEWYWCWGLRVLGADVERSGVHFDARDPGFPLGSPEQLPGAPAQPGTGDLWAALSVIPGPGEPIFSPSGCVCFLGEP